MSILGELKRRRVVRAAVVYAAVGWAVVQAADVFVPALRLPESVTTTVALFVLLGFPLAMALSWAFDITPEGVMRSSPEAAAPHVQGRSSWIGAGTAVIVILALVVGGVMGWVVGSPAPVADDDPPDRSSIAVLPFVDMSPDGTEQYLGDGIAEELLNVLARVPGLRVAARTSAFALRDANDVRTVADSLHVATVMEGSVRRDGDRIRITAQLIDAESGYHLFSDTYDREVEGLVEVQEEIATAVARELRLPLRIGLEDGDARTVNPGAYDDYLRGLTQFHQREVGRAATTFRRALERDSTFADAWAYLAQAEALAPYYMGVTWDEAFTAAERAARRALALDSTSAAAHTALANIHRDRWEWDDAEASYKRALALVPDDPELINQFAQHLMMVGQFGSAIDRLERAQELDPLAWVHPAVLGWAYLIARRYDDVEAPIRRALSLDPRLDDWPLGALFHLYEAQGRVAELEAEADLFEDDVRYQVWQLRHDSAAAVARLDRYFLETRGTPRGGAGLEAAVAAEQWAIFYRELDRWVDRRRGAVLTLWIPQLDFERFEPRFKAVMERTGLPE